MDMQLSCNIHVFMHLFQTSLSSLVLRLLPQTYRNTITMEIHVCALVAYTIKYNRKKWEDSRGTPIGTTLAEVTYSVEKVKPACITSEHLSKNIQWTFSMTTHPILQEQCEVTVRLVNTSMILNMLYCMITKLNKFVLNKNESIFAFVTLFSHLFSSN